MLLSKWLKNTTKKNNVIENLSDFITTRHAKRDSINIEPLFLSDYDSGTKDAQEFFLELLFFNDNLNNVN